MKLYNTNILSATFFKKILVYFSIYSPKQFFVVDGLFYLCQLYICCMHLYKNFIIGRLIFVLYFQEKSKKCNKKMTICGQKMSFGTRGVEIVENIRIMGVIINFTK